MKKRYLAVVLLLVLMLTGCASESGQIKVKNSEISGAILYALEGDQLQYDVFCYGKITGAAILDETGNGIDSPEKLAAVLGTADAPEAMAGATAENRTLGKAVTADITTDGRGNLERLVIRSVTDRPVIGIT